MVLTRNGTLLRSLTNPWFSSFRSLSHPYDIFAAYLDRRLLAAPDDGKVEATPAVRNARREARPVFFNEPSAETRDERLPDAASCRKMNAACRRHPLREIKVKV
jgi:hypothetical protein